MARDSVSASYPGCSEKKNGLETVDFTPGQYQSDFRTLHVRVTVVEFQWRHRYITVDPRPFLAGYEARFAAHRESPREIPTKGSIGCVA